MLPAVLVGDQDDEANYHLIGNDLFVMFLGVAIFTSILLISIIFGKLANTVQICFLARLLKTFFLSNKLSKIFFDIF